MFLSLWIGCIGPKKSPPGWAGTHATFNVLNAFKHRRDALT